MLNKADHYTRALVLLIFAGLLITVGGCERPEGYGGTGSAYGVLEKAVYNDDYSELISTKPAVDEQVFILFGESETVNDRVETSATGAFAFEFLRAGEYHIYYESEDSTTSEREDDVAMYSFTLKDGEDLDVGTLRKIESIDYDDGLSSISGTVRVVNYKNSSVFPFLEVKDTAMAQEQEVYIVYNNRPFYEDRTRTGKDGYFEFQNLIPGTYEVYVYSENLEGATEMDIESRDAVITENGMHLDVGLITINRL